MLPSSSTSSLRKVSTSSLQEEQVAQQQARSKGRKRWGLNIAGKSGSLKSTKSDKSDKSDQGSKSGEEGSSRQSSGRGMGAMMLANLHGQQLGIVFYVIIFLFIFFIYIFYLQV